MDEEKTVGVDTGLAPTKGPHVHGGVDGAGVAVVGARVVGALEVGAIVGILEVGELVGALVVGVEVGFALVGDRDIDGDGVVLASTASSTYMRKNFTVRLIARQFS